MLRSAFAAALIAAFALPCLAEDSGAADEYAKALDKENTDRDINAAMEIYKSILKKHKDEEEVAAKAQYRIGECWEKLNVAAEAKLAYEALVRDFPGQAALVDKAKERLAALAGQQIVRDPARELGARLDSTKIDMDFTDSTLFDISDFITEFCKSSCLVDPAIKDIAESKISFVAKDLALKKVLDLLADSNHIAWTNWHGVVFWTSPDRVKSLQQFPDVAAGEGAAEEDKKVDTSIGSIKISLNFTETPVEEAFSFIREVSGLNVIIDKACPKTDLTFKFDEMTLRDALTLVAFEYNLEISIKGGCLYVKGKQ